MIDIQLVILGILMVHLFFFVGFQYQVLNLLDEIAFPSNDPIMTSTLELEEPEEEELLDKTKCLGSKKNGEQCGRTVYSRGFVGTPVKEEE